MITGASAGIGYELAKERVVSASLTTGAWPLYVRFPARSDSRARACG
jgi:hypothetical protein